MPHCHLGHPQIFAPLWGRFCLRSLWMHFHLESSHTVQNCVYVFFSLRETFQSLYYTKGARTKKEPPQFALLGIASKCHLRLPSSQEEEQFSAKMDFLFIKHPIFKKWHADKLQTEKSEWPLSHLYSVFKQMCEQQFIIKGEWLFSDPKNCDIWSGEGFACIYHNFQRCKRKTHYIFNELPLLNREKQ